jgi:hypothetical protein
MKWCALFVLATVALSGCKQGSGSRCQLRSDCGPGLLCVLPANGNCVVGGVCEPATTPNVTCASNADCKAGFTCQASTDCTNNGANECVANVDMMVPDDFATQDLAPATD